MGKLLFLTLTLTYVACGQVVEWLGIVHDPPGTTPTTIYRTITYEKDKPTYVRVYQPPTQPPPNPGHYEAVQGTLIDTTWWCLHPEPGALILGLAVEINDYTYTFSSGITTPESGPFGTGQPTPRNGCGSAINVVGIKVQNNPGWTAKSIGAMLWRFQ